MNRKIRPKHVIACPHCGMEYAPGEVYIPNHFFGRPQEVVRDDSARIIYCSEDMDTNEEFTCENCGCEFVVIANLKFKTMTKDTYKSLQ